MKAPQLDTVMTERSHYWIISFLIKQQSLEFCCSDEDSCFLCNGAVTEVRRLDTMESCCCLELMYKG
jgi:hypothetical protein